MYCAVLYCTVLPSPVVLQDVGQPVGHCDDGGLPEQVEHQPLNPGLARSVQAAGGLVQDQDPVTQPLTLIHFTLFQC